MPKKFSTRLSKTVEYTDSNSLKYSSKDHAEPNPLLPPFKNQRESEFDWSVDEDDPSSLADTKSQKSTSTVHLRTPESENDTLSKLSNLESEYQRWKERTSLDFSKNESQFHDFTPDSSQTEQLRSPSENSFQSVQWSSKDVTDKGVEGKEKKGVVDVGSTAKPLSKDQSSGEHLESTNKEVQSDQTPKSERSLVSRKEQTDTRQTKPLEHSTTKVQDVETTDEITVETKVTQVKMVSLQLLDSGEVNLMETTQVQTDTDLNETKKTREKEEIIISHGIEGASNSLNESALTDVTNEASFDNRTHATDNKNTATTTTNINNNKQSFTEGSPPSESIPSYDLYKTWEVEEGMFLATSSYEPDRDDVISLHDGEKVEVLDQPEPEWWLVRKTFDNRSGFVPSKLLKSKSLFDKEISDLLSPMLHSIISNESMSLSTNEACLTIVCLIVH